MKILGIINDSTPKKQRHFADYIDISVDYENGKSGFATITRAEYDRIMFQQKLRKEYNIPEKLLEDFAELCSEEYQAAHIYDNCD